MVPGLSPTASTAAVQGNASKEMIIAELNGRAEVNVNGETISVNKPFEVLGTVFGNLQNLRTNSKRNSREAKSIVGLMSGIEYRTTQKILHVSPRDISHERKQHEIPGYVPGMVPANEQTRIVTRADKKNVSYEDKKEMAVEWFTKFGEFSQSSESNGRVRIDLRAKASIRAIYRAYKSWCEKNDHIPLSFSAFHACKPTNWKKDKKRYCQCERCKDHLIAKRELTGWLKAVKKVMSRLQLTNVDIESLQSAADKLITHIDAEIVAQSAAGTHPTTIGYVDLDPSRSANPRRKELDGLSVDQLQTRCRERYLTIDAKSEKPYINALIDDFLLHFESHSLVKCDECNKRFDLWQRLFHSLTTLPADTAIVSGRKKWTIEQSREAVYRWARTFTESINHILRSVNQMFTLKKRFSI
jgi:hypothetical protein